MNVVRYIKLMFTTEGEQKATAALKGVQSAQEQLAKSAAHTAQVTETSAKHQLSMANSMERLERRFNQTARAQFEYERVQKQVNAAVAQNPALQARANDVLSRAAAHYGAATAAQSTYARGLEMAGAQAAMFASRAGAAGGALVGLGPAGIAAGIGLAIVAGGLVATVKAATDLAERSGKLVDFAESTGLTTTALQALNKAGAEVGINQEKVGTVVERFTTELAKLRTGSGELFEQLQAINPELVRQLASTNDVAKAWEIMSRAIAGATDQVERNRLVTAVAGRRNIGAGRLLTATDQAGGIGGLTERAGLIVSDQELRRWDELGDKIAITSQQAKTAWASIYSDAVLNASLKFHETNLAIAQTARDFTLSPDFKRWLEFMTAPPRAALGALFDPAQFVRSPTPPSKTGGDDVRSANTEAEQASLALSRQLLAVQNQLTDQFNLQIQALGARTQEERVALAVEQRRVELSKTNISDAQLATELERTRTLAVARTAASHRDAMTAMSGQLAIAQAVTVQERMGAQQLVTYNQLRDQGRSHEQATLEALMQRQVTQAQLAASGENMLRAAENQHAIITATTEQEKLRATEVARTAELTDQLGDAGQAALIAAQERKNAEAAINQQIEKQAAAYRKAAEAANQLALAAQEAAFFAQKWLDGFDRAGSWLSGKPGKGGTFTTDFTSQAMQTLEQTFGKGGVGNLELTGGGMGAGLSGGFRQVGPLLARAAPNEQGLQFIADQILGKTGSLEAAIAEVSRYVRGTLPGGLDAAPDAAFSVLRQLQELMVKERGGDTTAQAQAIEQQIAFLRSQPRSIERDRAIFELIDSLEQLRESTDALNSTIGLDPLYSQGHGYVGIGYYPSGGRSPRIPISPDTAPYVPSVTQPTGATGPMIQNAPMGGSMTSPGTTMIDPRTGRPIFGAAAGGMWMVGGAGGVDSKYVPLALTPGELIEVTPEAKQGATRDQPTVVNNVTNNFQFPPSRSYGDRRTQRHLTEGFGRAMAQAQ